MQNNSHKTRYMNCRRRVTHVPMVFFMVFILLVQVVLPYSLAGGTPFSSEGATSLDIRDVPIDQSLSFLVEATPLAFVNVGNLRNLPPSICYISIVVPFCRMNGTFFSKSAMRLRLSTHFLKLQINRPLII